MYFNLVFTNEFELFLITHKYPPLTHASILSIINLIEPNAYKLYI